jgi:hypothetical protein
MSRIQNLEVGVLHNLKAYKIEKGMSEAAAAAWAQANFSAGMALVQGVLDLPGNRKDVEKAARAALIDLKAWAQSTT